MGFRDVDVFFAHHLPGDLLKDFYPRGMRRLAEYGLFRKSYPVETPFGFSIRADRLDVLKWYVFYFGCFEPHISKAWSNLLRMGDHVLDIGGNVGYHALLAASRVGPSGKVTTFEPSGRIAGQMRENIALNGFNNIELKQMAVMDRRGEIRLYFGGESAMGHSSTVQGNATDVYETVAAASVADVVGMVDTARVRLIKIDVEGAEEKVLAGLHPLLGQLRDDVVMFVEISPDNAEKGTKMLQPFLDAGYEARLIENRYSPAFYRNPGELRFSPLRLTPGTIHDVVLTKDAANFSIMERGR